MSRLPEFVCENSERADELIEYFQAVEKRTNSILFFKSIESVEQVAKKFSDKGLFYFDADDGTKLEVAVLHEYYTKRSEPQKPLKYELLPEHIKQLLICNFMEVEDFSHVKEVHIKHAYD